MKREGRGAKRDIGEGRGGVYSSPSALQDDRKSNGKAAAILSTLKEMTSSLTNERPAQLCVQILLITCVKCNIWKSVITADVYRFTFFEVCQSDSDGCGWRIKQKPEVAALWKQPQTLLPSAPEKIVLGVSFQCLSAGLFSLN